MRAWNIPLRQSPRYDYKRKAAAFKGVRREPHSINPQTMNDKTLRAVGRKHTVEDIRRVFREQERRTSEYQYGFDSGSAGRGCRRCPQYHGRNHEAGTDNVTVHTLAVKRALDSERSWHSMT